MEAMVGTSRQVAKRPAQFFCVECGYGASRVVAPERHPVCGGSVWEREPRRPFTNSKQNDA